MAVDLEQMLIGVEARLKTVPKLNVSLEPPGSIVPPYAWVGMPPIPEYRLTMQRGRFELRPTVTLLVSKASDRGGTLALARYANPAGTYSIAAAMEGDQTLGGHTEVCVVESFRPLGQEEVGALGYFGGEFTLLVVARGN